MPELPEVETTRRGLEPHVVGRRIRDVVVRNPNLRWPVPPDLACRLRGTILPSAKTVLRLGNQITRSLTCLRKTYGNGNLLFKEM